MKTGEREGGREGGWAVDCELQTVARLSLLPSLPPSLPPSLHHSLPDASVGLHCKSSTEEEWPLKGDLLSGMAHLPASPPWKRRGGREGGREGGRSELIL